MILPNCREVTGKLASGDYRELPWHARLLVRMHLAMCEHCSRFARQLGLIAQAMRELWGRGPDAAALEAAKRRIATALRKL